MRRFIICEIDNDYRTMTGTEDKWFSSREEARDYCDKESWSGYRYLLHRVHYEEGCENGFER